MNLRFRIFKDNLFKVLVIFVSFSTLLPLFLILFTIIKNGLCAINIEFFTQLPKPPGEIGGGVINSIVGTFVLIIISFFVATPLGVIVGIFLSEVKNKFSEILTILVNILQGIPSIVIGIIVYLWIVAPLKGFSAFAGGVALGIIMLPLVIKTTEETLKLVPFDLKEASYSLGASYTRTILKVILPAGFSGIVCGILLGILRIAGETAPLLFTAFGNPFLNIDPFKPVDALPLLIFNYAMSPYEDWHRIAWGASLVLIMIVLSLNIMVKLVVRKWETQF